MYYEQAHGDIEWVKVLKKGNVTEQILYATGIEYAANYVIKHMINVHAPLTELKLKILLDQLNGYLMYEEYTYYKKRSTLTTYRIVYLMRIYPEYEERLIFSHSVEHYRNMTEDEERELARQECLYDKNRFMRTVCERLDETFQNCSTMCKEYFPKYESLDNDNIGG